MKGVFTLINLFFSDHTKIICSYMQRETIFSGMIKGGHVGMRGPKKVRKEMDDGLFHVMQIRTDSEIV